MCESSLLFVARMYEHYETMDTVILLRDEIKNWTLAGMPVTMT